MQTKLKFILYVIGIFITIAIITGCIYEKQQSKITIHKQQMVKPKQQVKKIKTKTDKGVDIQAIQPVNLGEFKLTAYCPCKICCNEFAINRPVDENGNEIVYGAIGERLREGYSIAVDPNVIPYRSKVMINGKVYEAQDCGGVIKGNRIDVYFSSHEDALEFGVKYAEVFLVPK